MNSLRLLRTVEGIKSYFARLTTGITARDAGAVPPGVSEHCAMEHEDIATGSEPSTPGSLELMAAALHRLSQPLTALRGSLELALLTESTAEGYRRNLQESLALANSMAEMVRSLRPLIEVETHQEVLRTVPLITLVEKAAEEFQGLAESRNVSFAIHAEAACYVEAGPERLRQVVLKAIHHAIDRSPAGEVVEISLTSRDRRVYLLVSDQGKRFSPKHLELFFNPFSPGSRTDGDSAVGGLEWVAAKRAVEAAGGNVQVESAADQGFCLRIILPEAPRPKS